MSSASRDARAGQRSREREHRDDDLAHAPAAPARAAVRARLALAQRIVAVGGDGAIVARIDRGPMPAV